MTLRSPSDFSPDFAAAAAVLCLCAVSAVAYGAHCARHGAPRFDRVDRQGSGVTLKNSFMNFGYWTLTMAGRRLAAWGVSPNFLSWLGVAWALGAGLAVGGGRFGLAALAAFLSGCCDALDGMVAGAADRRTKGGVVLDSVLDRYADFALILGAALFYRRDAWFLAACLLAMHGSYMISYATAKAEAIGSPAPDGAMKRPERWTWLLAGLLASAIVKPWLSFSSGNRGWPFAAAIAALAVGANLVAARRLLSVWSSAGGNSKA